MVIYVSLCQGKELWLSMFLYAKGRSYSYLYSFVPGETNVVIDISLCPGKELWLSIFPYATSSHTVSAVRVARAP